MEIISINGLEIKLFDQKVATIIGNAQDNNGFKLMAQAKALGRTRIELCDWLFCLAKTNGTSVWTILIDRYNINPEDFVNTIHDALEFSSAPAPPTIKKVTKSNVSDNVTNMLTLAYESAQKTQRLIDEKLLTKAILINLDDSLRSQLNYWLKGSSEMDKWINRLEVDDITFPEVMSKDGKLERSYLSKTGINFLRRVTEDAASIRAKKITTRHIFYSIIGNITNFLTSALVLNGIDINKDLHVMLTRELSRPGRKRLDNFQLNKETILPTIVSLLKKAQKIAHENSKNLVSESIITKAFVDLFPEEITRLLPPSKSVDIALIRKFVSESIDDDEEEEEVPKYTTKEIEQNIKDNIIGQDQAIEAIMPWIKRLRVGLPREGRPAGVFLFTGPTGTGKTQLAKELAKYVFGDEEMMIFLEMGQYQSKESMNNFVGASPGYVGYGEGRLTNGLRDKPESIILFDEIEKANTEVFDALLRFADEGLISDPAGPIRDGRKCIIVMTSNAGQQWLRDHLTENPDAVENPKQLSIDLFEAANEELRKEGFRPEFLGRVDDRITFMPFELNSCRKILDIVLKNELSQIKEILGVEINVTDEVKDFLAQVAHNRSLEEGARTVPRAINTHITTPAINLLTDYQETNNGETPQKIEANLFGVKETKTVVIEIL